MLLLNQETMYSLLVIFFFMYYIPPYKVKYAFHLFTSFMASLPSFNELYIMDDDNGSSDNDNDSAEVTVKPKYEDKYLDHIRHLPREFIFNEEEKALEQSQMNDFYLILINEYNDKIKEIKNNIHKGELELEELEHKQGSDEDFCNIEEKDNEIQINTEDKHEDEDKKNQMIMSVKLDLEQLNENLTKMNNMIETQEGLDEIKTKSEEMARQHIIDKRLDKLKNAFVMDKTPLGNVLMVYNNKRESFEYYSDNTIPYRFLEPVCRKYVKIFDCRPIYFDMEEELQNSLQEREEKEEKDEKEREEREKKEKEEKERKLKEGNVIIVEAKKNVFAKFKSYNKESGTGHVSIGVPPKNSIPNNNTKASENVLLKKNTNRYSYEGKLSNFNVLKKVDRKVVDKKYAMTFADFKKLQQHIKND